MGALPAKSALCLIMAGGSGTRFWPLSQKHYPKQFLKLVGKQSLLRATYDRCLQLTTPERIAICGLEAHRTLLAEELPEIQNWVMEPQGRNTAACVLLSALSLQAGGFSPETVMAVFPADHHVGTPDRWLELLEKAIHFAGSQEALVTLGIHPTKPHTGYGYIEKGKSSNAEGVFEVSRFVEKPDEARAQSFLASGNFFWNSGIFVWSLQAILSAFEKWQPEMLAQLSAAVNSDTVNSVYAQVPSLPIDKAIMEKADNVYVLPADIEWTDLGSWNAVYEQLASSEKENLSVSGEAFFSESQGCLVQVPPTTKVAVIGLENVVVVEHDGRLLITRRDRDQKVKEAAERFDP
ncbi:MAG: mannose-1-phosphate guanylyltransferase [Bdellovibrionales bacterium]|nr:mannose-1-phosphate guanylyltransferase [Bdellovibrionales bacterium]